MNIDTRLMQSFFIDSRFEHFYEDCNGFLFMRSPTVYRPLMCWLHWALCSSAGSHIWCITRCISGSEASREDVQKFSRSLSFPLQWLHRHNCFQTDKISKSVSVCVCVCVCACVHVCMRACVRACLASPFLLLHGEENIKFSLESRLSVVDFILQLSGSRLWNVLK